MFIEPDIEQAQIRIYCDWIRASYPWGPLTDRESYRNNTQEGIHQQTSCSQVQVQILMFKKTGQSLSTNYTFSLKLK